MNVWGGTEALLTGGEDALTGLVERESHPYSHTALIIFDLMAIKGTAILWSSRCVSQAGRWS